MRAYLLKQAIDGRVVNVEMESIGECSRLLASIANNVNQLARRANGGGHVHADALRGVQESLDRVLAKQGETTAMLAEIIDGI
jgi:nanoRNase/pAp phosphatase (c-di-AMP/oligoRNAs hydrolase)